MKHGPYMKGTERVLAWIVHKLSSRGAANARLARQSKRYRAGLSGDMVSGEEREANAISRAGNQPPQKEREISGLNAGCLRSLGPGAMVGLLIWGAVQAQEFAIPWFSIDNGGGVSVGGGYALWGTVGQPDAGAPASGGGYTVTGGFLAGAGAASGVPLLAIEALAGGQVRISWLAAEGTYVLQQSSSLESGVWRDTPGEVSSPAVLPVLESARLYRLRRK
ncbi:MAG: hypothetical protein J0M24_00845 [Verrucomicrobia bacterium]|nr:hypothetical protein [Verrucomicrobiota bacterium]